MPKYDVTIVTKQGDVEAHVVASSSDATTSGWTAKVVECAEQTYSGVKGTCPQSEEGALAALVTALHLVGAESVQPFRPCDTEGGRVSPISAKPIWDAAALARTGAVFRLATERLDRMPDIHKAFPATAAARLAMAGQYPSMPGIHKALAAQQASLAHLNSDVFSRMQHLFGTSDGFQAITRAAEAASQLSAVCYQRLLAPMSATTAVMAAQQRQFRQLSDVILQRTEFIRSFEAATSSIRLRTEVMASFQRPSLALQANLTAIVDMALRSHNSIAMSQTYLRPVSEAAEFIETTLQCMREEPDVFRSIDAADTGIETAALQATASTDLAISIIREDMCSDLVAEKDVFVRPTWNLYDVLGAEIRGISPLPDGTSPELQLSALPAVRYTMLANTVCGLVVQINSAAELSSDEPVFAPTNRLLDCALKLPHTIATTERDFAEFVDALYQVLYEGSGEAKRFLRYVMDEDCRPLWQVKHLRRWYRHDLAHGDPGDIKRKQCETGKTFIGLIRRPLPLTASDYRRAQYAMLGRIHDMLQRLLNKLAEENADS